MCFFFQLRLLQDAIKREEDYLAEERRREIQARAEADEEAKCAYYLAKQEERETRLQQVRTAQHAQHDIMPAAMIAWMSSTGGYDSLNVKTTSGAADCS